MDAPVAYEQMDRWEVGVSASRDASQRQVSFVNAINTYKGGTHVNYIADQVAAHLVKVLKKRKKISDPKPNQIKNHLNIFVSCLIVNPTFDSQTKEFMTSKTKSCGSECKLSEKFFKAVEKSDIVTTIESYMNFREKQALKKAGGTKKIKLTGIAKLDDANFAGSAKSADCTLIVTEGDSAKSLAMSGIAVVGRDYYGCFPLRGKLLNVRDADTKKIKENEEIKNLVDIMGLKYEVQYDVSNIKSLRYGKLMIMSDQDVDGSHIKGLVINFIHSKCRAVCCCCCCCCCCCLHTELTLDCPSCRVLAQPFGCPRLSPAVHHAHCQGVQRKADQDVLYAASVRRVDGIDW
jgi:DNA topoisomerase-2